MEKSLPMMLKAPRPISLLCSVANPRSETIIGFHFFFTISSISDSRFLSDSRSLPFLIYDLLRVPFLFHDLFIGLSRTVHVSLLSPDSVTTATAFR
jgi:hypothetical protein